jgi:hypothetical protein
MTYHINATKSSSQFFHSAPWLDFNMVQTWASMNLINQYLTTDYNKLPTKPTGLGEGSYEDGPQYPPNNGGIPINALAARGATAAFSAASMWADRARFTTAQAVTRN